MNWRLLACALIGYLLGCLNGAIVISKVFQHEDVREKGSGNAGLTNFIRNYGGATTFLVIFMDLGKVILAGWIAGKLCPENRDLTKMLAGVCAMIGHMFPVFFRFKGGKGVLSGAAVCGMMDWRILVIGLGIFFLIFLVTRYVSLGSILAATAFAVSFVLFYPRQIWINCLGVVIAALAIYMHRGNIARLFRGEERKTYLRKSKNVG